MSVRIIHEALKRRGGEASVQELSQDHPLAAARCPKLVRQGLAERVAPGRYRLTERGWRTA